MRFAHALEACYAVAAREVQRFVQQRSRLASSLVRPTLWLVIFAAGFQNVFGVAVIPPYESFVTYQVYVVPGLLAMTLLFNGMQSSLAMVYDREMGMMRLLLTAPLPRAWLLGCKLAAGTLLSVLQALAFFVICALFRVDLPWWPGVLTVLPALALSAAMLGALGLLLSVSVRQLENFAGTMNFVIFPMFFLSPALYPLWKMRESGAETLYWISQCNPFTHAVELIRFALYGQWQTTSLAVVVGCLVLFFTAAALAYDPQRGMVKRRAQA